jgi:hypothetical protein
MKAAVIVVVMLGLLMFCGCENTQLVQCQKENAALKAEVQKAQADASASQAKIEELQKKDQETQTKALNAIGTMLEKENAKSKAKDQQIKQLEAELAKIKAAADSK